MNPCLVVTDPNGRPSRVPLAALPFRIGRAPDSNLVLRDSRISRNHAQIVSRRGELVLEDLSSRHGVFVDGRRMSCPLALHGGENIEFGVPDGYRLKFEAAGRDAEVTRPGTNLTRLKSVLEVARSLQSSFSPDDVFNTVIDAALAATGAGRGFLLLFDDAGALQCRGARSGAGGNLPADDLRVPLRLIQQALESRRELFTMSFDPATPGSGGTTVAGLELRSVACIPLVRINLSGGEETQALAAARLTAGVLYLDSRAAALDLADGNRELLQTLAIEASTVLENARLLEEERARRRIEEELERARGIQQGLLPSVLPETGWFAARGYSQPTSQVGGDYFDVVPLSGGLWSFAVADVSGKGVSASLLTGFLQGALLGAACSEDMAAVFARINRFLCERAGHGKYATVFYATLDAGGMLTYVNAGHCAPFVVHQLALSRLEATSMPVGLSREAEFVAARRQLAPGDRIIVYTDGVTDARNAEGQAFGRRRLRETIQQAAAEDGADPVSAVRKALGEFTAGAAQADDVTLLAIEYRQAEGG